MMSHLPRCVTWAALLVPIACRAPTQDRGAASEPARAQAVERAAQACLDDLHRLASSADGDAYFALFAPDAVYLGTGVPYRLWFCAPLSVTAPDA